MAAILDGLHHKNDMSEPNDTGFVAEEVSPGAEGAPANGLGGEAGDSAAAARISRLELENAELKDQILRLRAEFENFRRRVVKEKEEIQEYASMEAVRPLLAIVDDFERALGVECADSGYAKGMELIYQRMGDTLRKIGLEPVQALGQPFDPNLHHAIDMVKTADAPDQTVLEVFQAGYSYKGKLVRPAIVKVAVEPDAE